MHHPEGVAVAPWRQLRDSVVQKGINTLLLMQEVS